MNISIPLEIQKVYEKLTKAGFEVYLVGGSVRNMLLEKFRSRLNLTPEQTDKVQAILEQTHKQFRALDQGPQSTEIRSQMRGKVRELLSEEQQRAFEVMTREYDQRKAREEAE